MLLTLAPGKSSVSSLKEFIEKRPILNTAKNLTQTVLYLSNYFQTKLFY
jgi:hypothetical protein